MIVRKGEELRGPYGTATEILYSFEITDPPDKKGTVGIWFLTCRDQSPAWDKYMLSCIHLRPIENVKSPLMRFAEATHEYMLYAMNPEKNPRWDSVESWEPLRPINFVDQVMLPDDMAARQMLKDLAQAVVKGLLWAEPPLSHQREPWQQVLQNTAAHYRGEHDHG